MNYQCPFCGNLIKSGYLHCPNCGALTSYAVDNEGTDLKNVDYEFVCDKVDAFKVIHRPPKTSCVLDHDALNRENVGLKQMAFHIVFTNKGILEIGFIDCKGNVELVSTDDVLVSVKLYADGVSMERIPLEYLHEEDYIIENNKIYKNFMALGEKCLSRTAYDGWICFFVPFDAQVIKIVIGQKEATFNNPFYNK